MVLFPGVTPEVYTANESVFMITDLVQSKKTHVPFEYYDLPVCEMPAMSDFSRRHRMQRKNLGARLQGVGLKPAPFTFSVLQDQTCKIVCTKSLGARKVRWLRKLVERQYRVHVTFDSLPVLMRSSELNYAVRGYPVGFKAPPAFTGLKHEEYYLYNHLKFTITYHEDPEKRGIHVTGFDVHPVTIDHTDETCILRATLRPMTLRPTYPCVLARQVKS